MRVGLEGGGELVMGIPNSALDMAGGIKPGKDLGCPNCGVRESEGGCEDLEKCLEAIARMEDLYITEIGNLLDTFNTYPIAFLMAGLEALDLLNIGLAATEVSGQVSFANKTARQILGARDGLELSSEGVLRTSWRCNPSLNEAMQQVAGIVPSGKPESNEAVIVVQRPSERRPLTLRLRSTHRTSPEPNGPAILVFILDPELPIELDEAELRQLYGLTSAETRLAGLLMEGKNLNDCCHELGIRRSTARTHLQHLFEKAGVQRQSELIFLLLRSVGLVRKASEGIEACTLWSETFFNTHTRNLSGKPRRRSPELL
jgi:DNA-binding CsgD family transcriptional regulator